ncbi:site-specific integrase [Acidobacterium sp. S8]|uniref:tyrosine-type recombinase/integrase n=1 Tax=Acidobacterium sp. S8 TaxID=1641854 RepID=UPI00131AB993|nr:site-specific integrase [Acidobacterium sp. S8]
MTEDRTGYKRGNGEGSKPKKLASGNYQAKIRLAGKRVYVTRPTAAEVLQEVKNLRKKFERGGRHALNQNHTVESFLNSWLPFVKTNKAPGTYRNYEQNVRVHLLNRNYKAAIWNIRLDKLQPKHVQDLLDEVARNVPSPTTIKNLNATLKTALTSAIKWEILDRNVAKNAQPPKQKKYQTHPLTEAESIALLDAVRDHRFEAFFYMGLFQGLRSGEVIGLQWSKIDFEANLLTVSEVLQRVKGEGVVKLGVKSEASDRTIPLMPIAAEALKRRRDRQQAERLAAGSKWKQDEGYIFTSRHGHRVMSEEPLVTLKKQMAAARFSPDRIAAIRFHDLRHTTADILQNAGVDLKVIQTVLGHSNFQITAKFYMRGKTDAMREGLQKVNDRYSSRLKAGVKVGAEIPVGVKVGVKNEWPTIQ